MNGTIPREHIPSRPIPPPENVSKVVNILFWSKFPANASRFTPPRGMYIPSRDKAKYPKSLRNFPGNGPLKKSPKSMEVSSIAAVNNKKEIEYQEGELNNRSFSLKCYMWSVNFCNHCRLFVANLSFFLWKWKKKYVTLRKNERLWTNCERWKCKSHHRTLRILSIIIILAKWVCFFFDLFSENDNLFARKDQV